MGELAQCRIAQGRIEGFAGCGMREPELGRRGPAVAHAMAVSGGMVAVRSGTTVGGSTA